MAGIDVDDVNAEFEGDFMGAPAAGSSSALVAERGTHRAILRWPPASSTPTVSAAANEYAGHGIDVKACCASSIVPQHPRGFSLQGDCCFHFFDDLLCWFCAPAGFFRGHHGCSCEQADAPGL